MRVNGADGVVNRLKGAPARRRSRNVVPDDEEQVDRLRKVYSAPEPVLLNHVCCLDHLGRIGVACEVVQHAKGHDAESWESISFTSLASIDAHVITTACAHVANRSL